MLATKETLYGIKRTVETCIGKNIVLRTNKGRKKVQIKEGVLEGAYPNVFIVRLDKGLTSERMVSYSYCDILTETVEIRLKPKLLSKIS